MSNAVHGLVRGVGREVVEKKNRGALSREIMLQGEDLPPVAEQAAGEQADLGEAVQNHTSRLDLLHLREDRLRAFAEFEIGRVQQALLLVGVEQTFGRDKFEDRDVVAEMPTVRGRGLAQLVPRFGQADVKSAFAAPCALDQVLHRDRGFAGPGIALEQIQAVAREATTKDVVEPCDAQQRLDRQISA